MTNPCHWQHWRPWWSQLLHLCGVEGRLMWWRRAFFDNLVYEPSSPISNTLLRNKRAIYLFFLDVYFVLAFSYWIIWRWKNKIGIFLFYFFSPTSLPPKSICLFVNQVIKECSPKREIVKVFAMFSKFVHVKSSGNYKYTYTPPTPTSTAIRIITP